MATQIQLRRGTAALWTSTNPILAEGEFGYETDTTYFKIGDGVTAWASLAYNSPDLSLKVDGAASSTDNAIARFDSTTGKIIQNSGITVSDVSGSSVTIATSAGTALAVSATDAVATTGASQAGKSASFDASNAVASTDTAGAAVGGSTTISAGDAARLTSGNAAGGDVNLVPGLGIGTANAGSVWIRKPSSPSSSQASVAPLKMRAPVNETNSRFIQFYGNDDTTEQGWIGSNAGHSGLFISATTLNALSFVRVNYGSQGLYIQGSQLVGSAIYKLGWGPVNEYDTPDTLMGRAAANSIVTSATGVAGSATSRTNIQKTVTAIADATATTVFTVTVPNAAHSASVLVTLNGRIGAGGAIGADEATGTVSYVVSLARTAGVNAVANISTAFGSATSAVAGATTVTVAGTLGAVSGAVGATNTFTIQVTVTKGGGASANHTCTATARLLNSNATGVTIA